jgi:hypothetical protein
MIYRVFWLARARALITCLFGLAYVVIAQPAIAGQPYETDDPEPVACHHVEVDLQYSRQGLNPSTTAPSVEIDYGPTQNVELSVAAQRGETELGTAIRFVPETKSFPQVGFLPDIVLKDDGSSETFLPIWVQKTIGKWTFYGGSGISQTYVSSGITAQFTPSAHSSFGAEVFTDNQRTPGQTSQPRFNLGYTGQLDEGHAIMLSAGRNFGPASHYTFYVGYQVILAPKGHAPNCRG